MRRFLAIFTILFAVNVNSTASAHHLCPEWQLDGEPIYASATQLFSEHRYQMRAGGDHAASECNLFDDQGQQIIGYFTRQPDFELNYKKDTNFNLRFSVTSACDSALLINTGAGNWYWDDDSAGDLDAQIVLRNPSSGTYDIWVGTMGPENCDAVLRLETFQK